MEKVVTEAITLGLNHIKITGGEPFLNPRLFEYLDMFDHHGLSLSFETNGTLHTKEILQRLSGYNIHQFCMSLDGSIAEVHERIRRVKGSYKKAVNGMRLLMENGIHPQVIFCLQKINAHDLENTIRLVNKMGIQSFEINPLALLDGMASLSEDCRGLVIEELLQLEKRIEREFSQRYPDMYIDLYLPPALKGIKEISRHALCTCRIHNICGILSNGDVSICGIGRRKRDLIMGNVKKNSIARIWQEGSLFKEIREKVPFQLQGICRRCLFKHHCLGFCRADILSNRQSMQDPFGMCEEAYQKGLFPKSRILKDKEMFRIDRALNR